MWDPKLVTGELYELPMLLDYLQDKYDDKQLNKTQLIRGILPLFALELQRRFMLVELFPRGLNVARDLPYAANQNMFVVAKLHHCLTSNWYDLTVGWLVDDIAPYKRQIHLRFFQNIKKSSCTKLLFTYPELLDWFCAYGNFTVIEKKAERILLTYV